MRNQIFHVGVQTRGTLALPAELRKRHHLDQPGAQVRLVEREDGVIELHPLAAVPADQLWFWSDRWQRMEQQADADIASGRTQVHDSVDELLADLER
ncbi:MAG: AbrB/MazE/SpoVT family DNA-binding domain-containing protein [Xanthomonadales bacterium]|nr:AbrB/MazE/SpoVT family DNA-binding domain-containing protein [Xanthomonadales bacterium]